MRATKLHSRPLTHILKEPFLSLQPPLNLSHELPETQENPSRQREGRGAEQASSDHRVSSHPSAQTQEASRFSSAPQSALKRDVFLNTSLREKMLSACPHSLLTGASVGSQFHLTILRVVFSIGFLFLSPAYGGTTILRDNGVLMKEVSWVLIGSVSGLTLCSFGPEGCPHLAVDSVFFFFHSFLEYCELNLILPER